MVHTALAKTETAPTERHACWAARGCSTAGLVAAAARGDQRAFEALVVRFDPLVRRVANGFPLSSHQVDDVAQATWTRLFRSLHRLQNPAAVGGWLNTTARRESLRAFQAAKRELPTDDVIGAENPDLATQVDVEGLADERWSAILRSALDALPTRDRVLLEMLNHEPAPSYASVAAALAIPIGSIGPRRARALARLRRHPGVASLRPVNAATSGP
jgi:RNA polymerase sigma factor (sigma-70 family)